MAAAIGAVKKVLATHARIDFSTPSNDPTAYPEGAYTKFDHSLLRLGMLTEIAPRVVTKAAAPMVLSASGPVEMALEPIEKSGDMTTATKRKLSSSPPGHSRNVTGSTGSSSGSQVKRQTPPPSNESDAAASHLSTGAACINGSNSGIDSGSGSGVSGGAAAPMNLDNSGQGFFKAPAPVATTTAAPASAAASASTTSSNASTTNSGASTGAATATASTAADGSVSPQQASSSSSAGGGSASTAAPTTDKNYWAKGTGYGHAGAPSKVRHNGPPFFSLLRRKLHTLLFF